MSTGRRCTFIAVLLVLLPGFEIALGAQPPRATVPGTSASRPPAEPLELDEILVSGAKPNVATADLREWLTRLVGQYRYEGRIEVPGMGTDPRMHPVTGAADCVGFGPVPGVQCQLNVRWQDVRGEDGVPVIDGISNLSPAMVLYGLEGQGLGIRYMQVDSKGIAARANGQLYGDTLVSRERCVNTPGDCQRVTRITAEENSDLIAAISDYLVDGKRVVRYVFVWHRVVNAQKNSQSGVPPK